MTKQISFTKYEHKVVPAFRQNINKAESTEDVKFFFVYTIIDLFHAVFQDKIEFYYDDISLMPGQNIQYRVNKRLLIHKDFKSIWNISDLSRVVDRLAESAIHRCRRLEKHPKKTDSKIRMV